MNTLLLTPVINIVAESTNTATADSITPPFDRSALKNGLVTTRENHHLRAMVRNLRTQSEYSLFK
jgi:hypothetical protein